MKSLYRRRTYRRFRRSSRKTPWYAKKYSLGQMAKSALKGVSYLKGLVNSELYKYDFGTNFNPSTSGSVTACQDIAQGDGVAARTGNSIYARQLTLNYTLINNAAATNGTIVTMWLIEDTQQIADTGITFTSVFTNDNVNARINPDTAGRYKILLKRVYALDANRPSIQGKIFKRMRHHIRYNGTASTDVQRGGLYWLVCSNQASSTPAVIFTGRLSYHDN